MWPSRWNLLLGTLDIYTALCEALLVLIVYQQNGLHVEY